MSSALDGIRGDGHAWWSGTPAAQDVRTRLFCFPYAGGGTAIFRGWDRLLPEACVLPVRLPGREMRLAEPAEESLARLVERLGHALAPMLDHPFAFFGHSMGGLIAHELTAWLAARGAPLPSLLCVSARQPPIGTAPPEWLAAPDLPDEEFVAFLAKLSPDSGRMLEMPDLRALLLPMLRADFRLCASWRPAPMERLPVPILALAGTDDPYVRIEHLGPWAMATGAGFQAEQVDGDHFFVTANAARVCRLVAAALTGAVAAPAPAPAPPIRAEMPRASA
jgi:medium-chain acyl-[acyl-carrier-protein] hydrolase